MASSVTGSTHSVSYSQESPVQQTAPIPTAVTPTSAEGAALKPLTKIDLLSFFYSRGLKVIYRQMEGQVIGMDRNGLLHVKIPNGVAMVRHEEVSIFDYRKTVLAANPKQKDLYFFGEMVSEDGSDICVFFEGSEVAGYPSDRVHRNNVLPVGDRKIEIRDILNKDRRIPKNIYSIFGSSENAFSSKTCAYDLRNILG